MDRELLTFYRERWREVEAIERQERMAASLEVRLRQFTAIYNLAKVLGISFISDEEETEEIRRLWAKLKGLDGGG